MKPKAGSGYLARVHRPTGGVPWGQGLSATRRPDAQPVSAQRQLGSARSLFESLEWLVDVWIPRATQLGLRYVAHVVQAEQHHDVLTARLDGAASFELQIFQDPADAWQWLGEMRRAHLAQA